MGLLRVRCVFISLAICSTTATGQLIYDFAMNPSTTGLDADLDVSLSTTGTLVGNWDTDTNPEGTRTRPGLFGPFPDDANDPVPADLGLSLAGSPQSATTGEFTMSLEPQLGAFTLSNYSANLLSNGPATAKVSISVEYDSFRTRNPSSTYIGGFPIELPIGDASIVELIVTQVDVPTAGTLIPSGKDQYDFTTVVPVELTGEIDFLGNNVALPATPSLWPINGTISLNGEAASIISLQLLDLSETIEPNIQLPQIPLPLPTLLPPGDTAHLLFDLLLSQASANLAGEFTMQADGVLVPEPKTCLMLVAGAASLRRRRIQS